MIHTKYTKTIVLILAGYVFFIFYGTLIPFNFSTGFLSRHIEAISWIPLLKPDGSRVSIPDLVQNILFFVPFGFLFSLVCLRARPLWGFCCAVLAGGMLSCSVEFLQLFTVDRTTSMTDVLTNMMGSGLGYIAALMMEPVLRKVSSDISLPGSVSPALAWSCLLALALVLAGMMTPFDFTLDFGSFKAQVKRFLFSPPLPKNFVFSDEGVVLLRFLLLSFAFARVLKAVRVPVAFFKAFVCTAMLGLALELAQLFIMSRGPSVTDMGVIVAGSLLGALLCAIMTTRQRRRLGLWLLILFVSEAIALQSLSPFRFQGTRIPMNLIPFLPYYQKTTFVALANCIDSALMYVPLAFALRLLFTRSAFFLSVLVPLLLISVPLEWMQGYVSGRYPDITDVLGALAGLVIGFWAGRKISGLSSFEESEKVLKGKSPNGAGYKKFY